MKRVKLLQQMTGTRGGQDWPPTGAELEVPDEEAEDLERSGIAEIIKRKTPASHEPEKGVERAVGPDSGVETRGSDTKLETRNPDTKTALVEGPKGPATRPSESVQKK